MATLGRCMFSLARKNTHLLSNVTISSIANRCFYHRQLPRTLRALYERRLEQGPEPDRPRSVWANWNYNAEVFAFGKRLGEEFKDSTLKRAFTHQSYVASEQAKRSDLGLSDDATSLQLPDNTQLAESGERLALDFLCMYLRHTLPNLPEEGVSALTEHLMKTDTLSHVGRHLGVTDLILCEEFPVSDGTISTCLKAVVGGLAEDQGLEQAHRFLLDFVVTQLVGKTLDEIWRVPNPMGLLAGVLRKAGVAEPEPRLIWRAGSETMVAAFMVGIYSDKELIGKAPGETVSIAEEMAARDALRQYFGLTMERTPFQFGPAAHNAALASSKPNPRLSDITAPELEAS